MKVTLATCGTRGDVQPMAVLGAALRARGHEALLCGPPEGAAIAEQAGCPFRPLGRSVEALLPEVPDPGARPVSATRWLSSFIHEEAGAQLDELPEVVRGCDLVVGATFVFGLRTVAEAAGVPYRFLAFCPQAIPSPSHAGLGMPGQRWPRWVNRLTWRLLQTGGNLAYGRALDLRRRRLGLPPAGDVWAHVLGEHPLVASDPELGVVPPDARVRATQTGHLPLGRGAPLPPDVEAFLDAGEPPVFVGFGSMTSEDPAATARLVLDAVRAQGKRALLSRGWGAIGDVAAARDVLVVGSLCHARLFPRVAAVVHHGGAGTTATAARAGAAQVLCPHMSDQFYWATQLEDLGLAPPAVSRARLSARRLGDALAGALTSDRVERRREVARALAARDGVGATIAALESAVRARVPAGA